MKNKIEVTIGIPAYNEQNNIDPLLKSIYAQTQDSFTIQKIIIISDGSTDNTSQIIKKNWHKYSELIFIDHRNRIGKARRLNELYKMIDTQFLIQLDADIVLQNPNTLKNLLSQYFKNNKLSVIYGRQLPHKSRTYIEKLAAFGFYTWEKAKDIVGVRKAERYNCFGQITGFSKKFLNSYSIPENKYITEDTYSFYHAKKNGFVTEFSKDAVVLFRLPSTVNDYLNQMSRYLSTQDDMKKIFGEKLINKYETIGNNIRALAFLDTFFKVPLYISLGFVCIHGIAKFQKIISNQKIEWTEVKSTKKLFV